MTYYLFEAATTLFECFLAHIFFNGWFGVKNMKRAKRALLMSSDFALHCIVALLPLDQTLRSAISYVLVLGIAAALYDTTRISALYSTIIYVALSLLSEYLCILLMDTLRLDTTALAAEGNARALYLALSKTVHFAIAVIVASALRRDHLIVTVKQVAPIFPSIIISAFICIVFFKAFSDYDEGLSFTLAIVLVGLLYINGIIVFNTQSAKSAIVEIEKEKLEKQYFDMQDQYYRNVVKDREETHALWHDLKKYVTAIEALVESGDNQHAKDEYKEISQMFGELGNVVDIENSVLNAILHHNIERAKSSEVSVRLYAQVPPELPIAAVDLSVIIGNTFDNAIEECATFADKKPQISVTLVQQNRMLFYEITNPCAQGAQAPRAKPGKYHGYGLKNVRRCVDKYAGSMQHGVSGSQYKVSIRLNCST